MNIHAKGFIKTTYYLWFIIVKKSLGIDVDIAFPLQRFFCMYTDAGFVFVMKTVCF
ncbi:hypothetical protein M993_03424 [Obesumbacterium proteus ATCC 12841]|uniref:Uncharacterized protein n=1 Tax=Obesumbacterium proteus ATCC 12841 TaxID=1354268 RepID=A0AA91EE80_9GAMM|nr:hypothetical protein M993_03424 [Obesumbacterium proteus ATCC 12841]